MNRFPGSVTSFSPFPVISNSPTSCVEPNRFFTQRRNGVPTGEGRQVSPDAQSAVVQQTFAQRPSSASQ